MSTQITDARFCEWCDKSLADRQVNAKWCDDSCYSKSRWQTLTKPKAERPTRPTYPLGRFVTLDQAMGGTAVGAARVRDYREMGT